MSSADEWYRRVQWRQDSFGAAVARLDEACEQDSYTNLERAGLVWSFIVAYERGWRFLKDMLSRNGIDANSPREAVRKSLEAGYLDEDDCETFLEAIDERNTLISGSWGQLEWDAETPGKRTYIDALRAGIDGTYIDALCVTIKQLDRLEKDAEAPIKRRYHPTLYRLHRHAARGIMRYPPERRVVSDGLKATHRAGIVDILAANDRVERAVLFGSRATGSYRPASDVDVALFGDRLTGTDCARLGAAMEALTVPQRVDLVRHGAIDSDVLREHIATRGVEWYRRGGERPPAGAS